MDSRGRSSLRSRRMAGGKFGSANPARRDGGDYCDGGDCRDARVKYGRVRTEPLRQGINRVGKSLHESTLCELSPVGVCVVAESEKSGGCRVPKGRLNLIHGLQPSLAGLAGCSIVNPGLRPGLLSRVPSGTGSSASRCSKSDRWAAPIAFGSRTLWRTWGTPVASL